MKSSRRPLSLVFTALGLAAALAPGGAVIAHPIQFEPAPMPNWEKLYPPEPRPACTTHDMSYRPHVWDPVIFGRYDPLDYQERKWAHDETADGLPSFSVAFYGIGQKDPHDSWVWENFYRNRAYPHVRSNVLYDVIPARASLLGGMHLIGGAHIRMGIDGGWLWTGPGWWPRFEDYPAACKSDGQSHLRQFGRAIGHGGRHGGQWEAPVRRQRAMLLTSYELHGGTSTIP